MYRRQIKKMKHVKPLVEVVVAMERDDNRKTTVASGSTTRKNPTKGIIMETVIILKKVFKRG